MLRGHEQGKMPMWLKAVRCSRNAAAQPAASVPPRRTSFHSAVRPLLTAGACIAATLLLVVPLLTLEADAAGEGVAEAVTAAAEAVKAGGGPARGRGVMAGGQGGLLDAGGEVARPAGP